MKTRKDNTASLEQGRPIYKEVEYVEIRIPGKKDTAFCGPANHRYKTRFPKHYKAFKDRTDMPATGTPLSEFPHVTRSMVEELAYYNIKTVEDLVGMSDTNASKFMGINKIRTIAREWLEAADETALIAERDALRDQMSDMKAQIAEMKAMMPKVEEVVLPPSTPLADQPETVLDAAPEEETHVPLKERRSRRKKTKTTE